MSGILLLQLQKYASSFSKADEWQSQSTWPRNHGKLRLARLGTRQRVFQEHSTKEYTSENSKTPLQVCQGIFCYVCVRSTLQY